MCVCWSSPGACERGMGRTGPRESLVSAVSANHVDRIPPHSVSGTAMSSNVKGGNTWTCAVCACKHCRAHGSCTAVCSGASESARAGERRHRRGAQHPAPSIASVHGNDGELARRASRAGLRTVRCDDGWRLARSYFLHENLHLTGAGYGAKDIYAKGSGFTPKEMLAVGWEAKQLQQIGLTVEELHHAGFTTCAPGRSRTTPARPQRRLPPRTLTGLSM